MTKSILILWRWELLLLRIMCGTKRLNPFFRLHAASEVLSEYVMGAVVCLRGGERGTCLAPPPFYGPSRRVSRVNSSFFW